MSDPHWQTFMEQAVRLFYFLAESPDQLCAGLLQRAARLVLEQSSEAGEPNQSRVSEGPQDAEQRGEEQRSCFTPQSLIRGT